MNIVQNMHSVLAIIDFVIWKKINLREKNSYSSVGASFLEEIWKTPTMFLPLTLKEMDLVFEKIFMAETFGFCSIFQMMFILVVNIEDCFVILIIKSANFHLASNPNNPIWRWLTSLLVHQHLLNQMFCLFPCQEWASFYDQLSRQACQSRHHQCLHRNA